MRRFILLFLLCSCGARSPQNSLQPRGETKQKDVPQTPSQVPPTIEKVATVPCLEAKPLAETALPQFRQIRLPMMLAANAKSVVAISAETTRTCALDCAGSVYCWRLIDEMDEQAPDYEATPPKRMMVGVEIVAMSTGSEHLCGVTEGNAVVCEGRNYSGELGVGNTDRVKSVTSPIGLPPAVNVVLHGNNSCATTDKGLYCWGENGDNTLGLGPQGEQTHPKLLPGIQRIAVNLSHSCGITADGDVRCWGQRNTFHEHGELGCKKGSLACGSTAPITSDSPTVAGLHNIASVAIGGSHSCALTSGGDVYCWGNNDYGQTGGPQNKSPWVPRKVDGLPQVASISAGGDATCATTQQGVVYCWGSNFLGQLGLDDDNFRVPNRLLDLPPIQYVSMGDSHTCALTQVGQVLCWGIGMDPRG